MINDGYSTLSDQNDRVECGKKNQNSAAIRLVFQLIVFIGICGVTACNYDPWPEPDPNKDDPGGDGDSDWDSDDDDDDADDDDEETPTLDEELIHFSALNSDGELTVVGLADAVDGVYEIVVRNEDDEETSFESQEDGSFAGRVAASSGETLELIARKDDVESDLIEFDAASADSEFEDPDILGDEWGVFIYSSDSVVFAGNGDDLDDNRTVIIGNISMSAGFEALTDCDTDCRFSVLLSATVEDELDIFITESDFGQGLCPSQSFIIPPPVWAQ